MREERAGPARLVVAGRFALRADVSILRPDVSGRAIDVAPRPVDVLRPDDLLVLRFSFVNLKWQRAHDRGPLQLVRATSNRPAYLVATFPPQHIVEAAFFE
jgi:hypothetical protein